MQKSKTLCDGCRDDYYNRPGASKDGCWMYPTAKVVTRYKIAWWDKPTKPGAFEKVQTLNCHHAPGRYSMEPELHAGAVDVRG